MGPGRSAGFRNPTGLTNQARGFLGFSLLAALLGIQHHARAYRSLAEAGESLASPELWGFRVLLGMAALTTAIVVSRWIHRANSNARALGAMEMAFTPRGAVGWYFVPIANLWKPYQAMREIWKASVGPLNWQRQRLSALLPCWWLLAIVGPSTASWVTWAARKGVVGIDKRAAEHLGEAVSLGVLVPASLLLLVIIGRVHDIQMTHYKRQRAAGTLARTAPDQLRSDRRNSTAVP